MTLPELKTVEGDPFLREFPNGVRVCMADLAQGSGGPQDMLDRALKIGYACSTKAINDNPPQGSRDRLIQIEKNIPVPTRVGRPASISPIIARMEIGDSILLPESDFSSGRLASKNSARSAWYNAAQRIKRKICSRATEEGLRIWRVT
jgi:hypothetical protein